MHDLRDYKALTTRQLTTSIGQLNHNTAPKIMTHLALRARQPHPLGNGRSRAKALKLLRRVKKAHKAGRIPFELTVTGCRIDRGEPSGRPLLLRPNAAGPGLAAIRHRGGCVVFRHLDSHREAGDLYLRRGGYHSCDCARHRGVSCRTGAAVSVPPAGPSLYQHRPASGRCNPPL